MKKNIFLLVLPLLLCLAGCKKDDDQHTNPVDQLPPATQTGANTAGCLVNGEPFTPKGYITGGNLPRYYNGDVFLLGIIRRGEDNTRRGILIELQPLEIPLEVGKFYLLNTEIFNDTIRTGIYHIGSAPPPRPGFYQTNDSITGELIITHHDFDNAILSGVFWFDAVNSEGEIVEVREGRFDVKY